MNNVRSHLVDGEELMAFLDGQAYADAKAVATHLESCTECQATAHELRTVSANLATWIVESPPRSLQHDALSAARGGLHPRKISWKRLTVVFASAATVFFVLRMVTQPTARQAPVSVDRAEIWEPKEVAKHDPEVATKLEESKRVDFEKSLPASKGFARQPRI